jgi:hypothetical protein
LQLSCSHSEKKHQMVHTIVLVFPTLSFLYMSLCVSMIDGKSSFFAPQATWAHLVPPLILSATDLLILVDPCRADRTGPLNYSAAFVYLIARGRRAALVACTSRHHFNSQLITRSIKAINALHHDGRHIP